MSKNIYQLDLHESTIIESPLDNSAIQFIIVTRVPNGWLYKTENVYTFVPFHNEFGSIESKYNDPNTPFDV